VSDVLARRYLALMRLYPAAYRQDRGDEIVATLLERGGARRWPPTREVLGLVSGALQAHLSSEGPVRCSWAGGLRIAVLALLALQLADQVFDELWLLGWVVGPRIGAIQLACGLVAFHAVLRDRRVLALIATVGWAAAWIRAGHLRLGLVVAIVLLLAWLAVARRDRLGALRPGWWSVVPAVAVLLYWPQLTLPMGAFAGNPRDYQQIVIITAIALLAVAALLDTRAAVVAAGLLAWQSVQEMVSITWTGDTPQTLIFTNLSVTTWGIVAAVLTVTLLLGGHLLARHRARLI
jgi:hypothetical protein